MKKSHLFLLLVAFLFAGRTAAQEPIYDPSLDPRYQRLALAEPEYPEAAYLWYPGQLSAHKQKQLREKSRERCSYVGYPGQFYRPVDRAWFRKTVKGPGVRLRWSAPGEATLRVNGVVVSGSSGGYNVPRGTHELLFEIVTPGRLPCLLVEGISGWEVSLDNTTWNISESDPRFSAPGCWPDDPQEVRYAIPPDRCILFDNVTDEGNILHFSPGGCAIIDFRHDEIGVVRLTVTGDGELSFNPGETPEEALNRNTVDYEQREIPPVRLDGEPRQIVLPERALRFLRIESSGTCTISDLMFEAEIWPVKHLMQFTCSDPLLNRIWAMAAATVHTGMHDFYIDGIKRDALPWAMDVVQTALAGDYLFGDRQVSRNGISMALLPADPRTDDLGIIDFPLYALIGLRHDYLRYGDPATPLMFRERILELLDFYASLLDENGFLSGSLSGNGFLPSWARTTGPETTGQPAYGQMILAENFRIGAYFADMWGERKLARRYANLADRIRRNIVHYFWDDGQRAFINGFDESGIPDHRISHHAQFWGILTELFPPEHYDHYFDTILPAMEYHGEIYSIEKGYEFLAYAIAGRTADMLHIVRNVWGDWVQEGFSRFPENLVPGLGRMDKLVFYDRPYGLSLCHPCNGVPPVLAILHGVMGFSQSADNPAEYTISPDLAGLDWLRGRIPVKEGFIELSVSHDGGIEVSSPPGCRVLVKERKI